MERARRKYPRKKVFLPVECTSGDSTQASHAWAMGGGGLFLGMSKPIDPGAEITVRFRPAQHLPLIEAKAKVRYQVPDQGVGIEFTEIKPEHRQMILLQVGQRMAEKRRFPRAPFAVQIEHAEGTLIGVSKDISVGGMFIETKKPLFGNSKLKLRFHLDDEGPIVITTVEVRYSVGKLGVGVQFIDLSPADRKRIETYIAKGETTG